MTGERLNNNTSHKISADEVALLLTACHPGKNAEDSYQSKVFLFPNHSPPVIIKSPSDAYRLRWLSRWTIRREYSHYMRLQGVPGLPHCYGLFNGEHLVLEYQPGHRPKRKDLRVEPRAARPNKAVAGLRRTIAGMHRRGVAHADLKRSYNLIHTPNNRLIVIDFGTALLRHDRRGGPLWRWAAQQDWNAWAHYGWGRDPDLMPPAVARLYRFTMIERIAKRLRGVYKLIRGKN